MIWTQAIKLNGKGTILDFQLQQRQGATIIPFITEILLIATQAESLLLLLLLFLLLLLLLLNWSALENRWGYRSPNRIWNCGKCIFKGKKKGAGTQRHSDPLFSFSAAKIWCFSRSVTNYNSSNCATRLSMGMKYECKPCLLRALISRNGLYQESTDWTIGCIPSLVYQSFTVLQITKEKQILYYCFEHLYVKDIIS